MGQAWTWRLSRYDGELGKHNLFVRERVELEDGSEVLMYFLNRSPPRNDEKGYTLIPSGRWEDYEREKGIR
jgi:gamma-glutamylcyclotransferase (GGCT)/AIG2-like uncharacterized protein YtfP